MGKYEDLEQLKLLKEEGTITDEEFEIQKYKILSNTNEKKTTEGIYIATLVLGIFTFLLGWVPILGLILGIIAAVLCAKSRKKLKNAQPLCKTGFKKGENAQYFRFIVRFCLIIKYVYL